MKVIDLAVIPRLVPKQHSFDFDNLLVSGCSHTQSHFGEPEFYFLNLKKNYSKIKDPAWPELTDVESWEKLPEHIKKECQDLHGFDYQHFTYITWPVYLRDLGNFSKVIDCSCSGAGNAHITNSIIYELEKNPDLTPANTMIAVQWTSNSRDDFIGDSSVTDQSSKQLYYYDTNVALIRTGGMLGHGNALVNLDAIKKIKSAESRSIENYLNIVKLSAYLTAKNFKFAFSTFSNNNHDLDTTVDGLLPPMLDKKLSDLIAVKHCLSDYLQDTVDGYHATAYWSHKWAEDIWLPELKKL